MSQVGQRERITQNRVVHFFQQQLGYRYLGDWQDRNDNKNIEHDILIACAIKNHLGILLASAT